MKLIVFLSTFLSVSAAFADVVEQAWESETVLNAPESVLYDSTSDFLYVSSINGDPNEKNGLGFISRLNSKGQVETLSWADGLNGPKGMLIIDGSMFVADIDKLVKLDLATGEKLAEYPAEGAQFLNDLTVDSQNRVYVSDMAINRIYRLEGEQLTIWLEDEQLENPNGIQIVDETLYLGTWGVMTNGFETAVPGRVKLINLADKSITDFAGTASVGNLDGLVVLDEETVLLSD